MLFEKTLLQSVYGPWKDQYIDYGKLKSLLREDQSEDNDRSWTVEDENRFSDEIFNVQLEKVARFQEEEVQQLRARVDAAMEKLKELIPAEGSAGRAKSDITTARLRELEAELDSITLEVKELKKFSNLNYTGFLKIVKKHDRKRGNRYRLGPMMRLSLAKRPFNSEQGYAPMLTNLSLLYFAIRQHLEDEPVVEVQMAIDLDSQAEMYNGERYTAHKFWVHPDNLLEVKTWILPHLPALVYSEQSSRELDGNEDPTVTSLYFDNDNFDLYSHKVDGQVEASSLRLRWFGPLNEKSEILLEQKTVHENGSSEERKIPIKEKYVKPFLDGEYKMEKSIQKMERQGQTPEVVEQFRTTADGIREFLRENKLEPVVRANYARTAYQKPGDTRVRISIDTNIAFIREDSLDVERPCRDPDEWHRNDIDGSRMTFPFKNINKSEVSVFPFAVLEIKLKEDGGRKRPEWIEHLMASHLVHPAPRFSKFVHGVASLFEDHVNSLPFWLGDLERGIQKDPEVAFQEEEERKAARAETEMVVGSFLGNKVSSYKATKSSPVSKSLLAERAAVESAAAAASAASPRSRTEMAGGAEPSILLGDEVGERAEDREEREPQRDYGTLSSLSAIFPSFSGSRYTKARRERENPLPPGVVEPREWIKNAGPLQIEPKVWLANERTFLKWQHICILLSSLAISLYTAAGKNFLAETMGVAYIAIAVFAGGWGYYMQRTRRNMIMQRSGRDFDNMVGPMVISVALMLALIVNFVIAYRKAFDKLAGDGGKTKPVNSSLYIGEL